MNPEVRELLRDLAGYLDVLKQNGSTFYFDEGLPEDLGAKSVGDDFERECAAFVRDGLDLVAKTRAHTAPDKTPEVKQTGMFDSGPGSTVEALPPPPPVPETVDGKRTALEHLAAEVAGCTACPLHTGRNKTVAGAGHPDATLMLIGEAPGQQEDRQGLPFVGRSGHLLTDILKAIGFAREDVFIGNVLKCRPPGNRDPERAEVDACEPFLREQIRIIQPRMILCLGRIAAQTLLGTKASLGSLRRSVHFFAGVPVMATYHPAALLRNPASKRATWDDVRKLRALHDALVVQDQPRS